MNPIDTMMHHRSIRQFKKHAVPPQQLSVLLDVAKASASSTGMQRFSIIRIVNSELKRQIADVCKQDYVADMPELLIFVVDAYRNAQIAKEQGLASDDTRNADVFFQGWTDGVIAAQTLVTAAELAGFGTVYLGSILNDAPKIIELLKLPQLVFPIVGLGFGDPDQNPMLKPKMPRELNVFDDQYDIFPNYMAAFDDYDEVMDEYYDLRNTKRSVGRFTGQVLERIQTQIPKRRDLVEQAKAQGFLL